VAAFQRSISIALVALCCGAATTAPDTAGAGAGKVDDARLVAAPSDARNWITAGGRYDNAHFSGLDQIDTKSVGRLAPRWSFHSGLRGGFETTPLVVDGTMYLTTPYDDVVALDATNGAVRWRYHHVLRHKPCCGPANRGAAVAYGRVYIATVDARLIALDQATGAVIWDTPLANQPAGKIEARDDLGRGDAMRGQAITGQTGIFANMAPLVYDGKVVVGVTGVGYGLHLGSDQSSDARTAAVVGFAGDYGHRGYYAAFDAATGKLVWRWYTIPDRGWEGTYRADTPDGVALGRNLAAEQSAFPTYKNAWQTGGGSAWTTPAFDPGLGLLYVGVGNPSPQFADQTRPGDNRDTVSLVALDAKTGCCSIRSSTVSRCRPSRKPVKRVGCTCTTGVPVSCS
jgi:alcohol dehydrogenase (cytochrome c)